MPLSLLTSKCFSGPAAVVALRLLAKSLRLRKKSFFFFLTIGFSSSKYFYLKNMWTPNADWSHAWLDVGVWCCNMGGEPVAQTWTLTALDLTVPDCLDSGRPHGVTEFGFQGPFNTGFHVHDTFLTSRARSHRATCVARMLPCPANRQRGDHPQSALLYFLSFSGTWKLLSFWKGWRLPFG